METDRRAQLVEAGWQLVDELPLHRVFAGVTSAAVADRAGVTTGSYFHHFAGAAEFADALVAAVLGSAVEPDAVLDEFVDGLDHMELDEVLRSLTEHIWETLADDPAVQASTRHQALLLAHPDAELAAPVDGLRTVGDTLRAAYRTGETEGGEIWAEVLRRTGRSMVEPFTVGRVTVALSAMFQGLLQRHLVDPGAVDERLFADVAAVLVANLTQPVGSRRRVEDVTALTGGTPDSPQARAGAARREATRRRIVAAAEGLFATSWEDVTASELAERAGVSTQTVLNVFGSVRNAAAATFDRHLPALDEAAAQGTSPLGSLRAVLEALARVVGEDAGAARALLDERLAARARRHGVDHGTVPLRAVVAPLVAACPRPGGAGDDALADALVDLTVCGALAPGAEPGQVADLALRLLGADADPIDGPVDGPVDGPGAGPGVEEGPSRRPG